MKDGDNIRKQPGMYIGDTHDGTGLHNMAYEIVHNAIDEARSGFGKHIDVVLNPDGSCTVRDNGRGIPTDVHPLEGVSAAEVIMTRLHTGGKFERNTYKASKASHGVGASVVNALSEWFVLRIWRDGKEFCIRFRDGDVEAPLKMVGDAASKRGTEVTFLPSPAIFTDANFNFAVLENRFREFARPAADINLVLMDRRSAQSGRALLIL